MAASVSACITRVGRQAGALWSLCVAWSVVARLSVCCAVRRVLLRCVVFRLLLPIALFGCHRGSLPWRSSALERSSADVDRPDTDPVERTDGRCVPASHIMQSLHRQRDGHRVRFVVRPRVACAVVCVLRACLLGHCSPRVRV